MLLAFGPYYWEFPANESPFGYALDRFKTQSARSRQRSVSLFEHAGTAPHEPAVPEASFDGEAIALKTPSWTAHVTRTDAQVHWTTPNSPNYQLGLGLVTSLGMAWTLLDGGFLLHASAVEIFPEKGWLFSGQSGVGKSTLADSLSPVVRVLTDDQAVVVPEDNRWFVGSSMARFDVQGPVEGAAFLERGTSTRATPLNSKMGFQRLTRNAILWPGDAPLRSLVLSNLHAFAKSASFCSLEVSLDDLTLPKLQEILP